MTARRRLPNRRKSEVVAFTHGGFRYIATVSRFDDGRLGEIFLDADKPGSPVSIVARDLAIAASLALQSGCDPQTLRDALTHEPNGEASGPLGGIIDLIEGREP